MGVKWAKVSDHQRRRQQRQIGRGGAFRYYDGVLRPSLACRP